MKADHQQQWNMYGFILNLISNMKTYKFCLPYQMTMCAYIERLSRTINILIISTRKRTFVKLKAWIPASHHSKPKEHLTNHQHIESAEVLSERTPSNNLVQRQASQEPDQSKVYLFNEPISSLTKKRKRIQLLFLFLNYSVIHKKKNSKHIKTFLDKHLRVDAGEVLILCK